jgi:hypothetical protein
MSACNDELITHLIFVTDVFLVSVLGDDILLNMNGLVQEFDTVFILIFFQVNASKIIHATSQFIPVVQLIKDLGYLMIIKQSLVVIALVKRVSSNFDSFGQVAKSQIKNIDFVISRSII